MKADGSIDSTFNAGAGITGNGSYMKCHPLSDGTIIITGLITAYYGTNVQHIIRIRANGQLMSDFMADDTSPSGVVVGVYWTFSHISALTFGKDHFWVWGGSSYGLTYRGVGDIRMGFSFNPF